MEPVIGPPPPPDAPTGKLAPQPPETKRAERVAKEVVQAPVVEKKTLRIDQKLLMSEVQLLLAEKRTSYALLRTGVSVSLVPLSMWTVLVATSKLWNVFEVIWFFVPLMILAVALLGLGVFLILHALSHLRHIEHTMTGLRKSDTLLEDLLYRERAWRVARFWRGGRA